MCTARPVTRRLGQSLEPLEPRLLMAGDVKAVMMGSVLRITGDSQPNAIEVRGTNDQGVQLWGGANTTLNTTASYLAFSGVTAIDVRLGNGNDTLSIGGFATQYLVLSSLTIDLGRGSGGFQSVQGGNLSITGNLAINASQASSDLYVDLGGNWNHVGGLTLIRGGTGNDKIGLAAGHFSLLSATLGDGADKLHLGVNSSDGRYDHFVSLSVTADLGRGKDTMTLYCATVDSIYANLGTGEDRLDLYYAQFGPSPSNTIDGGNGEDTLYGWGPVHGKRKLTSFEIR